MIRLPPGYPVLFKLLATLHGVKVNTDIVNVFV